MSATTLGDEQRTVLEFYARTHTGLVPDAIQAVLAAYDALHDENEQLRAVAENLSRCVGPRRVIRRTQEWIDKHMAVARELAVKSANSVGPDSGSVPAGPTPSTPVTYATEWVECDRCDGDGEYEDDLWVTVRCYSCWGTGHIEVCAECLDDGEECAACGCSGEHVSKEHP